MHISQKLKTAQFLGRSKAVPRTEIRKEAVLAASQQCNFHLGNNDFMGRSCTLSVNVGQTLNSKRTTQEKQF